MRFAFATAAQILFGPGRIEELPSLARPLGSRALIVTGKTSSRAARIGGGLASAGIQTSIFPVDGEPTLEIVRGGARAAREFEFVIGFGGGSAMDAAKAIAALATNSGEPLDYLEVIGKGQVLEHPPLPFVLIPTTAGTGAEVTRNAVLGSPEHEVKASLRSPLINARLALVDPELTVGVPAPVTANTGLDTLTQLIEPYVSIRANVFTDAFCTAGLRRVREALPRAYHNGSDRAARESMSFASLLSGLALANAGLGVVHGFAGPLGGMLGAPHGALCAAVLPHGISVNIRALRERAPEHEALQRYTEGARILTGDAQAGAEDCVTWTAALCGELGIAGLRSYGLEREQIPTLVEKAARASSMKANPIQLTSKELTEVVERASN
jgi:alcohol dehydrogenase class IV